MKWKKGVNPRDAQYRVKILHYLENVFTVYSKHITLFRGLYTIYIHIYIYTYIYIHIYIYMIQRYLED
jgi:hypothetical protein